MSIHPVSYFSAKYSRESLQVRKKSGILAMIAIGFGIVSLVFALLMAATKAMVPAAVFVGIALFCSAVLALLRVGKYHLASSAFLYGLMIAMFVAIKFDQYVDIYESYVMGTLGCFLLVVATLVADRPSQAIVIGALNLASIEAIYWIDSFPKDGRVVSVLAIQNLSVSSIMTILSAIISAYVIRMASGLIGEVESDAKAAERSYDELNAAMGLAQASAQRTGESLAASVARTMLSIAKLSSQGKGISLGMDELDGALSQAGEAN